MEKLVKLLELINFGDEKIDFDLKNHKLVDKPCEYECSKWIYKKFDTYISSYRYRKKVVDGKYISLDINIRPDRTKELIEKVKKQFEIKELKSFCEVELNESFMILKIDEIYRVDFVKVHEVIFDKYDQESLTSNEVVSIQIVKFY